MFINSLSEKQKKDLIRKNWLLQQIEEVPFIIEIEPFHAATTKFFYEDDAELKWNVSYHKQREGIYDYGMHNIKLNKGIGTIASAFGCKYRVNEEADPCIKPLICEKNRNDVYKLEVPNAISNPVYKEIYDRINFFQSHSNMPLRLAKVPSPLVTASLIWNYTSFIEATMIYPKEVHALLEKVTAATIDFVNEQIRRIKNLFTMGHEVWYIPRDLGLRISDDISALMSPNLYREFGVKYNSQISRAFGGLIVHSCGDVQNVVETMMEIEDLRGFDFTVSNNPNWEIIRKTVAGKVALNLRYRYSDQGIDSQVDLAKYSRKIIEFFGRKGIFLQTSGLDSQEARNLGNKLHGILN